MDVSVDGADSLTSFSVRSIMPPSAMTSPVFFATFVTVVRTNIDTLSVDVKVGRASDITVIAEYKNVPVMMAGGVGGAHGRIVLPQQGDVCVMLFLNGVTEYRVILGSIFVPSENAQSAVKQLLKTADVSEGDEADVHNSGVVTVYKKDGTVKIISKAGGSKNVEIKANGEIVVNAGTNGAARKEDSIVIDATTDPAFITFLSGVGYAAGSVTGKVSGGSSTVKVG